MRKFIRFADFLESFIESFDLKKYIFIIVDLKKIKRLLTFQGKEHFLQNIFTNDLK